ncbi:MAG: transcriptional regulator [SAR86 cluster bacterium]|uniref:Transcriptional regulator n=1 Tax=SAR86 cluster bacterium TaxID=2030880 RepID=A0A2A5AQZ4_9GAMM|nr:MAG: transcriptional regulator [SAR86 cluster bacterium]
MKWKDINQQHCSIARTLAEIGDRWTLLIVRDAIMGARRFEDFVERSGAARNIVTDRLNKLSEAGILQSQVYQEKPDRFEYRLTEKGQDLYPLLLALVNWGDKWQADGQGDPVLLTHIECGHQTHVLPTCSACGKELAYGGTRAELRDSNHPYWKVG